MSTAPAVWEDSLEGVGDADRLLQDDVAAAEPSIDEKTSKLVSRGRWSVPGYKVRFQSAVLSGQYLLTWLYRKNSATSPCYRRHCEESLPFVYPSIVDIGIGRIRAIDLGRLESKKQIEASSVPPNASNISSDTSPRPPSLLESGDPSYALKHCPLRFQSSRQLRSFQPERVWPPPDDVQLHLCPGISQDPRVADAVRV